MKKILFNYWGIIVLLFLELLLKIIIGFKFDYKYINLIQNIEHQPKLEPLYLNLIIILNKIICLDYNLIIPLFNEFLFILLLFFFFKIFFSLTKNKLIANLSLFFIFFSPISFSIKDSLHRNFLAFLLLSFILFLLSKNNINKTKKIFLVLLIGLVILLTHRVIFLYYLCIILSYFLYLISNRKFKESIFLLLGQVLSLLMSLPLLISFFIKNVEGATNLNINKSIEASIEFFKFKEYFLNILNTILYFQIQHLERIFSLLILISIIFFIFKYKNIKKENLSWFILSFVFIFIAYKSESFFKISNNYSERIIICSFFYIPIILFYLFKNLTKNKIIINLLLLLVLAIYISNFSTNLIKSNVIGNLLVEKNSLEILPAEAKPSNKIINHLNFNDRKQYAGNDELPASIKEEFEFVNSYWLNNQEKSTKEIYDFLNTKKIPIVVYNSANNIRFLFGKYNRLVEFNYEPLCDEKYFTKLYEQQTLYGKYYIFKVNDTIKNNVVKNNDCIEKESYLAESAINELPGKTLYINNYFNEKEIDQKKIIKNDNYEYFYYIGKNDAIVFSNDIIFKSYEVVKILQNNYFVIGKIKNQTKDIVLYTYSYDYAKYLIKIITYIFLILFIIYYLLKRKNNKFKNNKSKFLLIILILLIILL